MVNLLRDNLQPTDFADAVCKVTEWNDFEGYKTTGYRIWVCRCGKHWFQRHEWIIEGKNHTQVDDWIYAGYYPNKKFDDHFTIDGFELLKDM